MSLTLLGQPANGRRKKAKKLEPVRAGHYAHRSSIISVPDGTGKTTPEYVNLKSANGVVKNAPSIDH